jgi:MFS transporter, ACS family, hexuronate transporter
MQASASSRAGILLLGLLALAGVLNYMDRQVIAVLKPLLQESLHWYDKDYARQTILFQLAVACGLVVSGPIVDRIGWRGASLLSVTCTSLAAMAHALAQTTTQLTALRLALGLSVSLGTPAGIKTVAETFDARQRAIAVGCMNAAGNLGAVITPLLTPIIALSFGWRGVFFALGALGLLWSVLWSSLVYRMRDPSPRPVRDSGPAPVFREVLRQRNTWAIAGAKALSDSVWWFLLFWAPDFFHRVFHLNMQGFALPLAVVYCLGALGSLGGGIISSHLISHGVAAVRARKSCLLMCALLPPFLPLALVADGPWPAVLILGATLAAHQGFSVNLFALATDVTPRASMATTIGVGALCGNLAGMGILQLAGTAVNSDWGYRALFGYCAMAYLLAFAWIHCVLLSGTMWHEATAID